MFRRRVKSALFIDFDNIVVPLGREFVLSVPKWLAWMEDGHFDQRRQKREFVEKRVYWNAHNEVHRRAFEDNGFEALACRGQVKNKSTADMIIALDALQSTYDTSAIKEYIVLTTDTDFIPLLERLGEKNKDTVAAVNPANVSGRVIPDHADIVIPLDSLRGACAYQRQRRSIFDLFKKRPRALLPAPKAPPPAVTALDLAAAAEHLAALAAETPGLPIGRQTVVRALKNRMPQFVTEGRFRFLDCGSYQEMIERVVRLRPDLRLITYRNGGIAIMAAAK